MSKANKVAILSHVEPGWNSDLVSADNEVTRRYDASVQGPRRDVVRYYALDILTLTYSDGRLAYVSINTGTRSTTSTRRHINNALRRHGIKARVAINPDTKRDAVRGHVLITPRQGAAPFTTVVERYVSSTGHIVSHDAGHDRLGDAVWPSECNVSGPHTARLPAAE